MKDSFDKAVSFVLAWEKYWSDDPKDPGKLTIWGVSSAYWPEEVEKMKAMSEQEAKSYALGFYKKHFWDALKCDSLPTPLDIVAFDSAVNIGVSRVKTYLDLTEEWRDVLMYRVQFYSTKKGNPFLGGWINRCVALWNICKKGG